MVIYCAGPCNVHPRRVLTAAGPPGGPNLTGLMGVHNFLVVKFFGDCLPA